MKREIKMEFKNEHSTIILVELPWNDGYELVHAIDDDCASEVFTDIVKAAHAFATKVEDVTLSELECKSPNDKCLYCDNYSHIKCPLAKIPQSEITYGDKIDCDIHKRICRFSQSHCGEEYFDCGDCKIDTYPLDD